MNGFEIGKILEEDFLREDSSKQLWYLYKGQEHTQEVLNRILSNCSCRIEECAKVAREREDQINKKIKSLEDRKKIDTSLAIGSGTIGGFIAVVLKGFFNLK